MVNFAAPKQQKMKQKPTNNMIYHCLVRCYRNQSGMPKMSNGAFYIFTIFALFSKASFQVSVKSVSNRSFPSQGNAYFHKQTTVRFVKLKKFTQPLGNIDIESSALKLGLVGMSSS